MVISNNVKQFIKDNIELIDNEDFKQLYSRAQRELYDSEVGELTEVLLSSEIDPLVGMTKIPRAFLCWTKNIKSVATPNTITSIGSLAFFNSALEQITIPTSVTTIGEYAFGESSIVNIYYNGTVA